jgi:hypothetical protein
LTVLQSLTAPTVMGCPGAGLQGTLGHRMPAAGRNRSITVGRCQGLKALSHCHSRKSVNESTLNSQFTTPAVGGHAGRRGQVAQRHSGVTGCGMLKVAATRPLIRADGRLSYCHCNIALLNTCTNKQLKCAPSPGTGSSRRQPTQCSRGTPPQITTALGPCAAGGREQP